MPQGLHTCYRCGGSCQGLGASVTAAERGPILAAARRLGIEDPLEGARTRTKGSRCVFLQQDSLCRLQILAGPTAKPLACQTYPAVHLVVEGEHRRGIDPGCLTAFLSASDGDPVQSPEPVSRGRDPAEDDVLGKLTGSISQALAALHDRPTTCGGLPPAMDRWARALLPRLIAVVLDAGTAPGLRARLRHLRSLDVEQPLRWDLTPEAEAHALEIATRMVWLQLGRPDTALSAHRVARDTLLGAGLCAAASATPARFAPALAAWSRLQRTNALRHLLDSCP